MNCANKKNTKKNDNLDENTLRENFEKVSEKLNELFQAFPSTEVFSIKNGDMSEINYVSEGNFSYQTSASI